jgi:hypothetical protein
MLQIPLSDFNTSFRVPPVFTQLNQDPARSRQKNVQIPEKHAIIYLLNHSAGGEVT